MNEIVIYKTGNNQIEVSVQFENETLWLNLSQISLLFERDKSVISRHINNIFKTEELIKDSVVAKNATTAKDGKTYQVEYYNLDLILSVGYRVNSKQGTEFRQWATARLKDYLIKGYAINEKRLQQKQLEVEFLKTGLRILGRAIENTSHEQDLKVFEQFAKGLALLDDYDHEALDQQGLTIKEAIYPEAKDYMELIKQMYSDFESSVFAKPKDESFYSSINQIKQSFGGVELYPSMEEKAANLLYLITKNHSFVDGNKRIAAACFVYFLQQNQALYNSKFESIISNETLATLTLYIANSRPEEIEIVKRLIISVLNRNK
ncbi:MAG: virulence protein RhuM/Fic/DOC family protein [Bacteroidetes bacterium]|jgi:prophage maintenance system killer protein|nr:virulence protein RhuM/Fic/DOC family protein [Bacteroidota bacterium]MBK7504073.1 virulence protein RhuM/Fic/DOC family protein [Bacteroidota bacterium]MBK8674335.1 virulence protein RhuM/Fic/DOC family protein [Bacteroidota bacterium]MBL0079806.1 virulence protein RhuM/Fic/DOC family protein [Bacteroidota bacterium]